MANEFYTPSNAPSTGAALSSATMRAEFQAIATGLDKLPTMTGNGSKLVIVNSSGTALQATTSISGLTLTSSAFNGTVGATTPSTGAFTTLSTTGNVTLGDASTDTVTVNGYMGVGSAASSGIGLYSNPSALAGPSQYSGAFDITGTSAATTAIRAIWAKARTPAAAITFARLDGLNITNAVKGAGSTITDQYGLIVDDQTQGTNNYGIASIVSSGSNKWNIYASGTANNAFAGNVRIGSTTAPTVALDVTGAMTVSGNTTLGDASTDTVTVNGYMGVGGAPASYIGLNLVNTALAGAIQIGSLSNPTFTSSAVTSAVSFYGKLTTQAAPFTLLNGYAFYAEDATKGAGSTITNQYGLYVRDQTQGTNNYGITSIVSSGANKWNIYASGTANNAFAGNVRIGGTTAPTAALDVTGSALVSGSLGATSVNATNTFTSSPIGAADRAFESTGYLYAAAGAVYGFHADAYAMAGTTSIYGVHSTVKLDMGTTATTGAAFYAKDGVISAGSLTNLYGLYIEDQTIATNNYGVVSLVSSGSNKWNIYASGTANNHFNAPLLVGTTTTTNNTLLQTKINEVTVGDATLGGAVFTGYNGTSVPTVRSPTLLMQRSRGTTDQSMTAVASGDRLGIIAFSGADGTAFTSSSNIAAFVDGTVSAGSVPSKIVISTSGVERFSISSAGLMTMAAPASTGAYGHYITNSSTLTSSFASLYVGNGTASGNTSLALATFGTAYTTAGAYIQDGSVIETGSSLSGGLTFSAQAGGMNFYTGGTASGNRRMTISNTGGIDITGAITGATATATGYENLFYNTNAATNAYAAIGAGNAVGTAASLRVGTLGTGWTTNNAYIQDGSFIDSGSALSAGLSVIAQAGGMRFYTGGFGASELRMTLTNTGAIEVVGTATFGYGTGSGGAVTQITSRTTGVTLSKTNGAITLFTAAGSATAASFTVTNTTVAATDTIVLSVKSSTNKYLAFVTAVAAGSFEITFYTTGGTASDAPVINFAVIKAVAA